jgi:hypothetical protein
MSTDKRTLRFNPFAPADDRLKMIPSRSVWPTLLTIGALTQTRHPFDPKNPAMSETFPTDVQGLERLDSMIRDVQEAVRDTLEYLGLLMASADKQSIFAKDEHANHTVGWLLCGLAELSTCLQEQLDDVGYSLAEHRTDYGAKTKESAI